MALCNSMLYKYVAGKHYDELNVLTPLKRATEMFKLQLENLELELKDNDEIFGWFIFDKGEYENIIFTDCIQDGELLDRMDAPLLYGSKTAVDKAHTLVDYGYIIDNGLIQYENKIDEELKKSPCDEYLLSMKETLSSIRDFTNKMKAVVDKKIENCSEDASKFVEIKNALEQVPFYPARTFKEAIQSIWLIHFLIPLAENAWYSISLGKFDEYVYPCYEKSIKDGMTREEAKKILHNFYLLLNNYCDAACLMNVGGNGYNELSKLIIECQKEFSLPSPILGAIVSKDTTSDEWNMLIDEKLFSMGQPTFYGKDACIRALMEKGIGKEKAVTFSNNSCMGIGIAGEDFNSMWGCIFSISAVLESALNCGNLITNNVTVPGISQVSNIDELYENFEKSAKYLFDICIESYETKASYVERTSPDPFLSILTKGCIENHCDRISGSKYHNITVECMGMINVSDGICAVDTLVFKEKKYTLNQLIEAVKNNFKGYEKIREDILKCSKFGQNAEADLYAVKVSEILQKLIRKNDNKNRIYSPSLHTLDANVRYGDKWGAGFDGRLSGEPFTKNASGTNSVRKKDHTSLVLSASKLPQYKFFGGQPIDLSFSVDMVKNHKKEISELIKVYLENGGLQLQVNAISSEVLQKAVDNPESYKHLVVRIGGYSTYFNSLSLESRMEFVERTKNQEI